MSFFEWWAERRNPGPQGRMEVHGDGEIGAIVLPWTLLRFGFTLLLAVAVPTAAIFADTPVDPVRGVLAFAGFVVYLLAGYFLRPKPDMTNLGYGGGLIDNPFRISDDRNRSLLWLAFALTPGYLLARPVVELFRYIAGETDAR